MYSPPAFGHLFILSKHLCMTPDQVDWGMVERTPWKKAGACGCYLMNRNRNLSHKARCGELGRSVSRFTPFSTRKLRVAAVV